MAKVPKRVLAKVGRKAARKAALKVGGKAAAKTAAKVAGSAVGVGELVMIAEGLPVAASEARRTGRGIREGVGEAREAWKGKKRLRAAGRLARTSSRAAVDVTLGTARTGIAALTAREASEALLPVRRNQGGHDWNCLLSCMIQLRTAYLYLHWNARSYANHLLFERLYLSLDEDIDTLAELAAEQFGGVQPTAPKAYDSVGAAERGILDQASKLAKAKGVSLAMENYLLNLTEHRRRALYLLRQAEG